MNAALALAETKGSNHAIRTTVLEQLTALGRDVTDPECRAWIRLLPAKQMPIEVQKQLEMTFQIDGRDVTKGINGFYYPESSNFVEYKKVYRDGKPELDENGNPKWIPKFTHYGTGIGYLRSLNNRYAIYLVVNPTNGAADADVTRFPTIFYETDGASKEEQWQQLRQLEAELGRKASLVVETRNSLHIYFCLDKPLINPVQWSPLQQRLIQKMDSDPSIWNPSRLMRLAGFDHLKYNAETEEIEKYPVTIQQVSDSKFSLEEIDKLLPEWDKERWNEEKKASSREIKAKKQRGEYLPPKAADNGWDLRNFYHHFEGVHSRGDGWDGAKCPAHNGRGYTSFRIDTSSGRFKCWAGCSPKEIYKAAVELAKSRGHVFPEKEYQNLSPQQEEERLNYYNQKVEKIQEELSSLRFQTGDRVIEVNDRFLPDSLLNEIPYSGNINVKVPMGMGKSTFIKKLLAKYPDRHVISITPTIALGRAQAEDWKIEYRADIEAEGINQNQLLCNTHRLGTCWDSLWRLLNRGNKNLIIIVDEAETGYEHLINSSTVNKNNRRPFVLEALKSLLKNAKDNNVLLINLDANLTTTSLNFTRALAPDLPVVGVITERKAPSWNCNLYTGDEAAHKVRSEFENSILEAIDKGLNVFIPCDSQKHAEELEQQILRRYPETIIRVDAKTSSNDDIKLLLLDIDNVLANRQPKILITTPTMGQGISITLTKEYVEVYQQLKNTRDEEPNNLEKIEQLKNKLHETENNWENLTSFFDVIKAFNFHLPPFKFRQMLGRIRHTIDRDIWVSDDLPINGCKSPLPNEQIKMCLDDKEKGLEVLERARADAKVDGDADMLSVLRHMDRISREILERQCPEMELWANTRARDCYHQKNRELHLKTQLEADGHCVNILNFDETSKNSFSEAIKEGKKERKQELAQKIAETEVIDEDEADRLQRQTILSEQEEISIQRHNFDKEYPGLLEHLTEIGIKPGNFYYQAILEDRKHWLNGVKLLWQYHHRKDLIDDDFKEISFSFGRFDKAGSTCLQDVKVKSGFLDFVDKWGLFDLIDLDNPHKEYINADFKTFLDKCRTKAIAQNLKLHFQTQPLAQKDYEQANKWINKRLERFSLKLEKTRESNKVRYYKLVSLESEKYPEILRKVIEQILDTKNSETLTRREIQRRSNSPDIIYTTENCCAVLPDVVIGDSSSTGGWEQLSIFAHDDVVVKQPPVNQVAQEHEEGWRWRITPQELLKQPELQVQSQAQPAEPELQVQPESEPKPEPHQEQELQPAPTFPYAGASAITTEKSLGSDRSFIVKLVKEIAAGLWQCLSEEAIEPIYRTIQQLLPEPHLESN